MPLFTPFKLLYTIHRQCCELLQTYFKTEDNFQLKKVEILLHPTPCRTSLVSKGDDKVHYCGVCETDNYLEVLP